MQEVWKDVKGYEGIYQVSNLGKVKSLERYQKDKSQRNRHYKERILKLMKNKYGYLIVDLKKDGRRKASTVHRLVAVAFISNPENKPCINHIDGNKQNNSIQNLEWCTYHENLIHAFATGLKTCKYGIEHHNHAEINQYDLQGNFIKLWYGFHEINRILGFNCANISACCSKRQHTAYGFIWRYKNDNFPVSSTHKKHKPWTKKKVVCLTNGVAYNSLSEASKCTGATVGQISSVCRGERKQTKGMVFRYEQDYIQSCTNREQWQLSDNQQVFSS